MILLVSRILLFGGLGIFNDPETWMGEFDPHYDSYSVSISTPHAINNVDSSYQPEGNSDENPWYAEDAAPMDLDNDIWWHGRSSGKYLPLRSLGPSTPISIMAVIDGIPHVTARIRVVGELATEYDVPDDVEMIAPNTEEDTTPSKHCYIECKSGAEFAIDFTVSPGFKFFEKNDIIRVNTFIDGARICSLGTKEEQKSRSLCLLLSQKVCQDEYLSEFPLNTETGDSASRSKIEEDALRAKGLGTIKLAVFTAKKSKKQSNRRSSGPTILHQSDFAEKALKGKEISHATALAATGDIIPNRRIINIENRINLGEFFFHYRSHEALQNEMVIPRTPSPEPPAVANDGDDVLSHLSESEIRRLAMERLSDSNIKLESSGIKREANGHPATTRPWKVVKLDDGKEAVDLTDE
ncbi:hypothetical protein HG531_001707 [Fusarium graminearum]|nr:hypothetical protein HG531_001707 [Fusarium graminearum]